MIELTQISVAYGNIRALEDITLSARPGEITAVLGANGAGKSSLLKTIAGLVPATTRGDVAYASSAAATQGPARA